MSRRLCRNWVIWLLPILALRAFLPVGFMWTAGPGGLELGFCPGQGSAIAASAAGPHADHGIHADHGADHGAHGDYGAHAAGHSTGAMEHHHDGGPAQERPDSPCPFGIAVVALSGDITHLDAALPEPGPAIVAPRSIAFSTAGPARADRIRGPPALS